MSSLPPKPSGFNSWRMQRADSIDSLDRVGPPDGQEQHRPPCAVLSSPQQLPPGQDQPQQQQQQQQQQMGDSKLSSSFASAGQREPIRSFIIQAHRDNLAPVNSLQYARSVREDTAELANYQLTDKTERRSPSFLNRHRSLSLRTALSSDAGSDDFDSRPATATSGVQRSVDTVEETSEPEASSPYEEVRRLDGQGQGHIDEIVDTDIDEGPSLLARALRRSPPHSLGALFDEQPQLQAPHAGGGDDVPPSEGHVEASNGSMGHEDDGGSAVFSDEEDGAETVPDVPQNNLQTQQQNLRKKKRKGGRNGFGFPNESTGLLDDARVVSYSGVSNGADARRYDLEGQKNPIRRRLLGVFGWPSRQWAGGAGHRSLARPFSKAYYTVTHLKCWDRKVLWDNVVVAPVVCFPAAIVGLLLNILDALSYGMILFPLGSPVFANLGSAGISIFYVSTIVSQLVFSSGSIFKGGIGSELIEVVPFFHSMAATITVVVGEDSPEAVISTTITSYALSSMLTGLVFYLMGHFRFGYIVGFIPRHILIGCIGGVGWFLVATGFEVTARIEGSLNYDLDTLQKLIRPDTVPLWIIPLAFAIVLFWGQKHVANKYFLPLYIIAIPLLFYAFVGVTGSLNPSRLRSHGWIFEGPPADEPWWFFYTLYQFDKVHWGAIGQCVPAMFALTFFGILHVPINVPALALNTGEDHADLNHELKLHGYSNFLSGCVGSIQNYLVYANTVFFMRSGGDTRLAGFELALLTFGVMLIGPKLIAFIPVMMVGCLIFDLGFELLVEAVWQPRKKLKLPEYATVIAIVLIMGIYDFVVGIGVGILLAFVSLIFQTSQVSAVRAMYAGDIVNSTVRRNHSQHHYLRQVGLQICVIKVAGYLFFGTIVSVEQKIRDLIAEEAFRRRPVRYLIIDLRHVTGLDYSAGEVFNTINRLLNGKGIHLVLSGVDTERSLSNDLRAVGLGEDGIEVAFLPDVNTALELCENELLKTFYASQEAQLGEASESAAATLSANQRQPLTFRTDTHTGVTGSSLDLLASSPRRNHLQAAARELLSTIEGRRQPKWRNFSEPLRLMLQIFEDVSDKNEDFWFRAVRYFVRREFPAGQVLFRAGTPSEGFYLLEKGVVRAEYALAHGQHYHESIVAGTTCGELPFFSETARTATVYADLDCVTWVLDRDAWQRLQQDDPDVAKELLRISLKLTAERMSTIPSSIMLMAD
ncbi:sulfate transporter [Niveomyces insectorum RCEF 264]|uniref:Sulfate transporter n=1 Tax=Niveomyces insectorum RCEF 264 TaxID=1081102 RepID=A0A167YUJ2_9HYPO|nr:sulfate transporter [Niveomyces insectorum RCEF 264]